MIVKTLRRFFLPSLVTAAVIASSGEAKAFFVYTLSSSATGSTSPARFGYVDTFDGSYTQIANIPSAVHRNLVVDGSNFLTTRGSGTSTLLGTLTRSGSFTSLGTVGRTIYGMSKSRDDILYGIDSTATAGRAGTISQSNGAWTALNSFSPAQTFQNPSGGRLAFNAETLYMAYRSGTGATAVNALARVTLGTTPTITNISTNSLYRYMVLTSYKDDLYGLYADGTSGSQKLYSIDTDINSLTYGTPTLLTSISGTGLGTFFHGAASPVPAPLPILGVAAIFGRIRKLQSASRKLLHLK